MAIPYLAYYIQTRTESWPQGMSYYDVEKRVLLEAIEHHYSYGKDGFLSEKTTLEGIFENLEKTVAARWHLYSKTWAGQMLELKPVALTGDPEVDDPICAKYESESTFIRWYK